MSADIIIRKKLEVTKETMLRVLAFLWTFLFLKFRKIIAYILKSKLLEE